MGVWILFAIALLLFAWGYRESFTDPDECSVRGVTRGGKPCLPVLARPSIDDPSWRSKIDAEAPIGGNDEDYIRALQLFYDRVYSVSATKPKDTDVEAFLRTSIASFPGVDPTSLRKILTKGFRVELTSTAAEREKEQTVLTGALTGFKGSELQPGGANDESHTRDELGYLPADNRKGDLPEGLYAPTRQYTPLFPGDFKDKSTSWTQVSPMSVCDGKDPECLKNVL
jgi:hypothetical protein